jgi:cytochrome b subunit of formate dehydrogenase
MVHPVLLRSNLARLGAALFLIAVCVGCAEPDVQRVAPRKMAQPSRLASPTALRKAQSPEEVTKVLADSVHSELDCSGCHPSETGDAGAAVAPQTEFGPARCDHCHQKEAALYSKSIHAKMEAEHGTRAAVCAQCHGDHDIYKVNDPRSRVAKRNVSSMCTACHESPEAAPRLRASSVQAGSHYLESIHGRALNEKGFTVAPACTDCHGSAHTLLSPRNPESRVAEKNVAETCGHCHEGVLDEYRTSIHFAERSRGNRKAPICTSCHSSHDIKAANTRDFRLASDDLCGKCHGEREQEYHDTFHGRASNLGDTRVAACYDCHTAHSINKSSDPRSTVSPANRVATCRKCHTKASPSFATFMPHADHRNAQKYPVLFWSYWAMTGLLLGTFAFFGVHTLFWFSRSMVYFFTDRRHFTAMRQAARQERNVKLYVRFRPVDRFCHLLIIVSFLTLVGTGMPLRFSSAPWAQTIFSHLGGAQAAGKLHRFGAFLTLCYFIIHLSSLVGPIRRRSQEFRGSDGKFKVTKFLEFLFGPDSPVPNLQDLRDFVANVKWFVGKGPRPTFDRFTYWEKFDYMAVFWGVTVIGLSGLVMWFPIGISHIMPGWIINVAHLIHSDEALLAAGFIFTFHFFNGHFRPEKFPLDPVIFSGRITEAEMQHERGRQYDRLKTANKLDELLTQNGEWASWKWVFTPFGAAALVVGMSMVIAIFWALLHVAH